MESAAPKFFSFRHLGTLSSRLNCIGRHCTTEVSVRIVRSYDQIENESVTEVWEGGVWYGGGGGGKREVRKEGRLFEEGWGDSDCLTPEFMTDT